MQRTIRAIFVPLAAVAAVVLLSGCPIPGNLYGGGKYHYRQCASVGRNYWLYVPKNYNIERRYPLVLTLHGMKPYDVSRHHVEMWSRLADEHQYLIVAPELQTSDSFGQFPLRKMNEPELRDVRCIMAIMDEVMSDWQVDRNAVLLSCWSMGGYLSHYIASEYGDRFAAFAPLQANFSNEVLTPANTQRWAERLPMFVFYGTGDFPKVTSESLEAIEWYRRLGFKVQTEERSVGHQRHPELAANFFEQVLARNRNQVAIQVTPPTLGRAPLAVNLWPQISSKIGDVRAYHWDFGSLGSSPLKSPNLLIRYAGAYPIRLVVTDAAGRQYIAETTLKVAPMASARSDER